MTGATTTAGTGRTFTLAGSHGELTADADTGAIVARGEDARGRPAYPGVRAVDVTEWRAFYPGEELAGMSIDCLDIGTLDRNGRLCPPELDFRLSCALEHSGSGWPDLTRFQRLELNGCTEKPDAVNPYATREAAEFFGVYGREKPDESGIAVAVHLFDMVAHSSALSLARALASGAGLSVFDHTETAGA